MQALLREQLLADFGAAAVWFLPAGKVRVRRGAHDDTVLEPSLAAGACVIVTGDTDVLALDGWRGVRIMRPATDLVYAG